MELNKWHHVAVTAADANGTPEVRLYVNGIEKDSRGPIGSAMSNAGTRLWLNNLDWNENFEGLIDEVRLYERVLTPDDVAELAATTFPGKMRYNADGRVPEYFNGYEWIGVRQPIYTPNAVTFDGTNDYLSVAAGTAGVQDSKMATGSVWFRRNSFGTIQDLQYHESSNRYVVFFNTDDTIRISGDDSSGATEVLVVTTSAVTDSDWHHLLYSFDLSDPAGTSCTRCHFYLDGTDLSPTITTFTDDLIDFDDFGGNVYIGSDGVSRFDGDMADFWFDTGTYIDLSVPQNQARFRTTDGNPRDLGSDGSAVTGTAPDIFLSGNTDSWHTNKGSGGGFTENGALTEKTGPGAVSLTPHSFPALNNPTPNPNDEFGRSVAVDGNIVVIGAYADESDGDAGVSLAGRAYVFDRTTGNLITALDNPTPNGNDQFGISVAMSGNIVVVGAWQDRSDGDTGVSEAGRAYVFNATTGTLITALDNPSPNSSDFFGNSVAVDGDIAVIGARNDESDGASAISNAGRAYVFNARTGALITALDNPSPNVDDQFGHSVAVSGNTAVVGAERDESDGASGLASAGRAYVFDTTTGALVTALDNPSPNVGDAFGSSVAVIGARTDESDGGLGVDGAGRAYIFDATTGALVTALDNPSPNTYDFFGSSVAVSGSIAVIGALADESDGGSGIDGARRAYVFDATTGALVTALDNPSPNVGDGFGSSVTVDDSSAIIGANFDEADGGTGISNAGRAYGFHLRNYCSNPSRSEGTIVYNADFEVMQYCDGESWEAMGPVPGAGGGCTNPTRNRSSMVYNSDHRTLQYCDGTNWVGIGIVAPDPCAGTPAIGDLCADGSIFAGDTDLYVTNVNHSAGAQWKPSMGNDDINPDSNTDGEANHANVTVAMNTLPAMDLCETLDRHGHQDWYLPALDELNVLYTNRAAINNNATEALASSVYWSSTEGSIWSAWHMNLGNGGQSDSGKNVSSYDVRCVRR